MVGRVFSVHTTLLAGLLKQQISQFLVDVSPGSDEDHVQGWSSLLIWWMIRRTWCALTLPLLKTSLFALKRIMNVH